MYDYHTGKLPSVFNDLFLPVSKRHSYNTRLATKMTFVLPKARTSHGLRNIKFIGAKIWNSIDDYTKQLSKPNFIRTLKNELIQMYN